MASQENMHVTITAIHIEEGKNDFSKMSPDLHMCVIERSWTYTHKT